MRRSGPETAYASCASDMPRIPAAAISIFRFSSDTPPPLTRVPSGRTSATVLSSGRGVLRQRAQGMSQKIRVGILFGGQSAEHEISILSARNVLEALDPARFESLLIGIDKTGRWLLQDAQRLLTSARDPRHVRIEEGTPARLPSTFGEAGAPEAPASSIPDVIFPVLHGTMG